MMRQPETSSDTHLFILDDDGLVFSEGSQRLFALNTAATMIWCWLDEGEALSGIADKLAQALDMSPQQAADAADGVLSNWDRWGLLKHNGTAVQRPQTRPAEPREPPPFLPSVVPEPVKTLNYRLLDSQIAVSLSSDAQADLIDACMHHLSASEPFEAETTFSVVELSEGFVILQDGQPEMACDRLDQITPVLKSYIGAHAINASRYFLNIHSGAVGSKNGCLMFPGAPGSGKSTLVTALAAQGLDFYSDEYVLLQRDSLHARSVPLAACAKSTGWDSLAPLLPAIEKLPIHERFDDKIVRYIPPSLLGPPAELDRSAPVSAVIFPRYRPHGTTALSTLSRVETLSHLMEECLVIPDWFDAGSVASLVDWIRQVECWSLEISSLSDACDLIRERWC